MTNQIRLAQAMAFAAVAHKDQFRWEGEPYITHPFEVAQLLAASGYSESHQIVAVLHDVLEDTAAIVINGYLRLPMEEICMGELLFKPTSDELEALHAITRNKDEGEEYPEYIERIVATSRMAAVIKAADCIHNLRTMEVGSETYIKHTKAKNTLKGFLDVS